MSPSSSDRPNDESGTVTLPASDYHRLMVSRRRRIALDILEDSMAPVSVEDVAMDIVERERDADGAEVDDLERVAIGLHHVHLPALAEAGIIDYDPASHRVESIRGLTR